MESSLSYSFYWQVAYISISFLYTEIAKKIFVPGFTNYRQAQEVGRGGRADILVRSIISHTENAISVIGANAVIVDIKHAKISLQVIAF